MELWLVEFNVEASSHWDVIHIELLDARLKRNAAAVLAGAARTEWVPIGVASSFTLAHDLADAFIRLYADKHPEWAQHLKHYPGAST